MLPNVDLKESNILYMAEDLYKNWVSNEGGNRGSLSEEELKNILRAYRDLAYLVATVFYEEK